MKELLELCKGKEVLFGTDWEGFVEIIKDFPEQSGSRGGKWSYSNVGKPSFISGIEIVIILPNYVYSEQLLSNFPDFYEL